MKFLTRMCFDENGAKDLSGTSWENIGVVFDTPGKFSGRAARFDGASYLKTTSEELNFGSGTDFTLAMWMKYSNAKNYMHQTLIGSNVVGSYAGYYYCALYCSTYSSSAPVLCVGDIGSLPAYVFCDDNTWHHIAITRAGHTVRLFIDGKMNSIDTSGMLIDFQVGGITTIGWLDVKVNDTYNYVGELDDVCVIKDCALWTEDFVPPRTYLEQSSFLYQEANGRVYGMQVAT